MGSQKELVNCLLEVALGSLDGKDVGMIELGFKDGQLAGSTLGLALGFEEGDMLSTIEG